MLGILAAAPNAPFVVDPFLVFSVDRWRRSRTSVIQEIKASELGDIVIVRSSASEEDMPGGAPGLYRSKLWVKRNDEQGCIDAIEYVIKSYSKKDRDRTGTQDEVIVQRQCLDVTLCGVVRSSSDRGYCHIDFDDETGSTDTVTAGKQCKSLDVILVKQLPLAAPWGAIREMVWYVQELLGSVSIVLEYAIDSKRSIHLFQARQTAETSAPLSPDSIVGIVKARTDLNVAELPLSDMTDWNPAELLGDRPKPLAVSLFKALITDGAWLEGRRSLGYRDIQHPQLLTSVAGKPYVIIERSFLSLTPASVSSSLAEAVVHNRIKALQANPTLHDKVELFLLFTAADVVPVRRTAVLREEGFPSAVVTELEESLCDLTNRVVLGAPEWARIDADSCALIGQDYAGRGASLQEEMNGVLMAVKRCRTLGVVPFARQARLAFVARDLMNRLREAGAVTADWEKSWWLQVHTILDDVLDGFDRLVAGTLRRIDFNDAFGHLRASTFDICSLRYDQIPQLPLPAFNALGSVRDNLCTKDPVNSVELCLRASGLRFSAEQFFAFARESTRLREAIKFEFTKLLSAIIEGIARIGELLGFTREEMAFVTLDELCAFPEAAFDPCNLESRLRDLIENRRSAWLCLGSLQLPELIFAVDDLSAVPLLASRPTFVTEERVSSQVVVISPDSMSNPPLLGGKVVVIESADPGFDWIFAFPISGLITKFGGANSHMAIRCSQLHLPAAIGCGTSTYTRLLKSTHVQLDCSNRLITPWSEPG